MHDSAEKLHGSTLKKKHVAYHDILNVLSWSVYVGRAWLLVHYVVFECGARSRTSPVCLHGRITIFLNHLSKTYFNIAIVSFGKFCVASSTRGRQTNMLQSTGETVLTFTDVPQCMQLPINNPLFTSFLISDKCGNNCVYIQ